MRIFELDTEIWLPRPVGEVFDFFADAGNLERITPPWLHFEITTPGETEMRVGARIDYRLRVRGLPIRWASEITRWRPPFEFVDVQRRGPYRFWHHTHRFESRDGGTLASDRVRYAVPGGALVHRLFVRRDVEAIFAFRAEALRRIFAAPVTQPAPAGERPGLRLISTGR